MNNKFDEMTKGLAQSVTRRQALRRVGVGLAGAVLTSMGLSSTTKAEAAQSSTYTCCRYASYAICEPPGKGCPPHISVSYRGGHSHIRLSSATAVQDCTTCQNGYV